MSDTQLLIELRWQKYVRCPRQGAWDDHVTLQAIANMFSVKINVLYSNHPIFSVTRGVLVVLSVRSLWALSCSITHYVGLDKLPVCGVSLEHNVQGSPNEPSANSDNTPAADELMGYLHF